MVSDGLNIGGRDGIRTRINKATWALPQAKPAVGNARQWRPVIGAATCILNLADKPTSTRRFYLPYLLLHSLPDVQKHFRQ